MITHSSLSHTQHAKPQATLSLLTLHQRLRHARQLARSHPRQYAAGGGAALAPLEGNRYIVLFTITNDITGN